MVAVTDSTVAFGNGKVTLSTRVAYHGHYLKHGLAGRDETKQIWDETQNGLKHRKTLLIMVHWIVLCMMRSLGVSAAINGKVNWIFETFRIFYIRYSEVEESGNCRKANIQQYT